MLSDESVRVIHPTRCSLGKPNPVLVFLPAGQVLPLDPFEGRESDKK